MPIVATTSRSNIPLRQRWRPAALLRGLLPLLLATLALQACSDDLDQRAIQPGEAVITMTSAERTAVGSGPGGRSSGESPISHGGALPALPDQRRIYFTHEGDLWQLPIDNAAAPVVKNRDILAYTPSPSGEQVALVTQAGNAEQFQVVNADSTIALDLKLPASPDASGGSVRSIAWSPQGITIAVSRENGSIVVVSADGAVKSVLSAQAGSAPAALTWSSDGQMLAYLDPALPGQPANIFVVPAEGGAPRKIVETATAERAVTAMSWIPTTRSLVYIQAVPGAVSQGGDIFEVDTETGRQRLLQPAGQFAPVAGALGLAVSSTGDALAFTVYVPGEQGPHFHGLWIYDFESRRLTQIETNVDQAVTDLWWASGQLIYRVIPESQSPLPGTYTGTEPFALYQIAPLQQAQKPAERYRAS